jgi:hypothetical protein
MRPGPTGPTAGCAAVGTGPSASLDTAPGAVPGSAVPGAEGVVGTEDTDQLDGAGDTEGTAGAGEPVTSDGFPAGAARRAAVASAGVRVAPGVGSRATLL